MYQLIDRINDEVISCVTKANAIKKATAKLERYHKLKYKQGQPYYYYPNARYILDMVNKVITIVEK